MLLNLWEWVLFRQWRRQRSFICQVIWLILGLSLLSIHLNLILLLLFILLEIIRILKFKIFQGKSKRTFKNHQKEKMQVTILPLLPPQKSQIHSLLINKKFMNLLLEISYKVWLKTPLPQISKSKWILVAGDSNFNKFKF